MPALSQTAVQKAYKLEATSVYAEASIASGVATLITANGASKAVASISKSATGTYVLTLDSSIPVKLWLGAPSVELITADTAASYRVISARTTGAGATLTIKNYVAGVATDLADGTLLVSATFTTSQVW